MRAIVLALAAFFLVWPASAQTAGKSTGGDPTCIPLDENGKATEVAPQFKNLPLCPATDNPSGAGLPTDAASFMAWYEALRECGPGQHDPLFSWLATHADLQAMRWFVEQEAAGEAGFDDLVALTQVKLPTVAKLELARNSWDEMGRGNPRGMHGPILETLVRTLGLDPRPQTTIWQLVALGNLMTALALNRRYTFQSTGALGAIEMTAPDRAEAVARGLARLGVDHASCRYFDLHAVLDRKHSADWNREVILPLVTSDPGLARPIAEGALMRLSAGARCFERYRSQFRLSHL